VANARSSSVCQAYNNNNLPNVLGVKQFPANFNRN